MKYNLQWIVKQKGNFEFNEDIQYPQELFKSYSQINGLKDINVSGTGTLAGNQEKLIVRLNIKGIMLLPCALTLEEVQYPFNISSTEVFSFVKPDPLSDEREVKKNIVDLAPVVLENIMIEVPMRVVKDDAEIKSEGKGWKILEKDEANQEDYIDPRLAKLKDYFKQ